MEAIAGEEAQGRPPRLDIGRFMQAYEWVNTALPDSVGTAFDDFVCDAAAVSYPDDVVPLFESLANSSSVHLRLMAAVGAHHVVRADKTEGLRLLARLRDDADEGVSTQALETQRDLPQLLKP